MLVFGLFHGLGLATKLMDLQVSKNGLLVNLIGFNLGVELGQVIVLVVVVTLLNLWRRAASFNAAARYAQHGAHPWPGLFSPASRSQDISPHD